jgi:hypothetical protein
MIFKQIGSNQMEVEFPAGDAVLVSYETPVAIRDDLGVYYKPIGRTSMTTSRHIKSWCRENPIVTIDGASFTQLLDIIRRRFV